MPETPPTPFPTAPTARDPVVGAVLGLLVPGLGHVYAGRPTKGLYYLALVGFAFAAGLWMTGMRAVNADREPLWFAGQVLVGLPALAVWKATEGLAIVERLSTFDLGLLYTAVAGLMNVVAIADVLGIVDERREAIERHARALRSAAASAAAADADARLDDDGSPAAAGTETLDPPAPQPPVAPPPPSSDPAPVAPAPDGAGGAR